MERVLRLVHGGSFGAGGHHPPARISHPRVTSLVSRPLLGTTGYSEHGLGMGSPSLTPLCMLLHQPRVFTGGERAFNHPMCSPCRSRRGHPSGTPLCSRGSRPILGTKLEAAASWAGPSQLSLRTRGAAVFLKAGAVQPALPGLSGDRRGLGSFSLPATIAGRSHCTCVCWV